MQHGDNPKSHYTYALSLICTPVLVAIGFNQDGYEFFGHLPILTDA